MAAQLVLFVAIGGAGLAAWLGQSAGTSWGVLAAGAGVLAIVAGGVLAVRGVRDLRTSLSPFPRPIAGAPLVESGAYRLIRHPIYSGLVLSAIGWGLVTGSIPALVLAGLLFLLFAGKSRREEAWLIEAHPGYAAYRRRTKRLIPWIY